MRLWLAVMLSLLVLPTGCTRYTLEKGEPEIELSETSIDFGSVERGYYRTISIAVYNQGNGTLTVADYAFQAGTSEAFYFEDPDYEITPNTFAELAVRYTPTHEGGDAGAIIITSDDEDEPELIIFLQGAGVVPHCEVTPSLLYFPTDEGAQDLSFQVRSIGSGPLTIEEVVVEDGTPEFTLSFPAGYEPPVYVDPGLTVDITVTYTPTDLEGKTDRVAVHNSDPDVEGGVAYVEVVAAGEPPDGENSEPLVEILTPSDGAAVLAGSPVSFTGQVADMEEAPEDLGILWHSTLDGYFGGDPPDAAGEVCLQVSELTAGTHVITLSAFDSEGAQGADAITLIVYEEDDELEYVISGGDTPYHYFHVDDDMTVEVNGNAVFVDSDGTQDHHPPTTFFAAPGDSIRIIATDQQYCTKALEELWIHLSGVYAQQLTDAISISGCEEHDDYDASYEGPWPNDFLDETHTITIP